jgi:antitoxin MazE
VQNDQIIIRPLKKPRAGWDEAFRRMAAHGDDQLLDGETSGQSTWDKEDWEWSPGEGPILPGLRVLSGANEAR